MASVEEIVADPQWLPQHYDERRDLLTFVLLPKDEQRAITFLSDEYLGQRPTIAAPVGEIRAALTPPLRSADFIFHTAFCCSTLLARAMDRPSRSFGLKEPFILIELAEMARRGRLEPKLLALILDLLARPFEGDERIVIKPGNEANILIEAILAQSPSSRALLLSSPIEDFLQSIAKKGMWGRLWARKTFARLRIERAPSPGFSDPELFGQTDLQIAALVWLQQRGHFAALLSRFPDRFASLDSSDLLAAPARAVDRLDAHLDLSVPGSPAKELHSAFGEHAKELGRRYDAGMRDQEHARMRAAFGDEIDMVAQWAGHVAAHMGLPMELAQPLLRQNIPS